MREVDIYMASLWRDGHIVKTIGTFIGAPELKSIMIIANNYTDDQAEYIREKVFEQNVNSVELQIIRGDNKKECGERLKYAHTGNGKYIGYIDDDLLLSPGYLAYMIAGCEKYNAAVSLHGHVLLPRPIKHFYRGLKVVYRCLGAVAHDVEVDLLGNGITLFRREWFTRQEYQRIYKEAPSVGMCDIIMGRAFRDKGIKRWVLAHEAGYVRHKEQKATDHYIWDKYASDNDKVQTDYVNKYWPM